MSKSKKVAILLILALICAVAAGFGIFQYSNASKSFIYVFNDNYKSGTRITKDMFSSIKVDSSIVVMGQKGSVDTYYITGDAFNNVINSNEFLLTDVVKNQPFTFTNLATTSGSSIERSLSGEGMAVTIPISGVNAVSNELRVGSIVNIYSTGSMSTKLLFENICYQTTFQKKK